MFYAYILKSNKTKNLYTGYTNDLKRRLKEHNNGASTYTRYRGPYELIYYEACLHEFDAKARELYLKSGRGKLFLKSRLKRYFEGMDLVQNT